MKKILFAICSVSILAVYSYASSKLTVFKSPYCGCCTQWSDIIKEKGNFEVETRKVQNVNEIKAKVGITQEMASCHTAFIDGYVIEGHVPYSAIKRLLKEKPDIVGLTVPKMPIGSEGMEQDNIKESYNVLYINKDGTTGIYEKH